ncbi:MAG: hypothetical protein HYY02_02965 [Chloroflexi bacterium]|nr:hypothetical protein [Chloroflexota bacterium]
MPQPEYRLPQVVVQSAWRGLLLGGAAASFRRALAAAAMAFLASRAVILAAVWIAPAVLPEQVILRTPEYFVETGTPRIIDSLVRWDGIHYLDVAQRGYRIDPDHRLISTRWPLYPGLMRVLGGWAGADGLVYAGVALSNLALFLSLALLFRSVEEQYGREVAYRSIWYLAVFPGAFFYSALYAEALLVLFSVLTLELLRRRRWPLAGGMGFLAALARGQGVLLVAPLLVEGVRAYGFSPRRLWRPALAGALTGGGFFFFLGLLWVSVGDPLAFIRPLQLWDQAWTPVLERPPEAVGSALSYYFTPQDGIKYGGAWIGAAASLLFVAATAWLLRRGQYTEGVFCLATLAYFLSLTLPVGTGTMIRYLAPIVPAYVAFGVWGEHKVFHYGYSIVSTVLLFLAAMLYTQRYWVG